jgi:hypothetical protein
MTTIDKETLKEIIEIAKLKHNNMNGIIYANILQIILQEFDVDKVMDMIEVSTAINQEIVQELINYIKKEQ